MSSERRRREDDGRFAAIYSSSDFDIVDALLPEVWLRYRGHLGRFVEKRLASEMQRGSRKDVER